ncbi:MAG: formate/nitrite transporter family protein [Bacteroides sp.]|nr:formate/nitrite transporter family protein [Bacteroides sp.]MCM1414272.1 formate/nitrite transporter family protein [Bacteroides sp.]MCM1470980.1 formate/nitrite transporter family protein [Bacteroides sp.]
MKLRTPKEITIATLDAGSNKVGLSGGRMLVQSIQAGAFIAFGGALSLIVGFGFPDITASNPSLQKLLSGAMFPIGLILVVVLGAELFTGNNAVLMPGLIGRRFGAADVACNWTLVYLGNFVGALAFAYFLVYLAGLTSAEPWHGAIKSMAEAKTSLPWMVVIVKGIGANWCVCLAVWLALAGHTLVEKALGCFLPVMAFVALGYEHCVANMFFIPLGMMEGASVSVGSFIANNLIPATIGNIIGGALFVGCINAWIHINELKKNDD